MRLTEFKKFEFDVPGFAIYIISAVAIVLGILALDWLFELMTVDKWMDKPITKISIADVFIIGFLMSWIVPIRIKKEKQNG